MISSNKSLLIAILIGEFTILTFVIDRWHLVPLYNRLLRTSANSVPWLVPDSLPVRPVPLQWRHLPRLYSRPYSTDNGIVVIWPVACTSYRVRIACTRIAYSEMYRKISNLNLNRDWFTGNCVKNIQQIYVIFNKSLSVYQCWLYINNTVTKEKDSQKSGSIPRS